MEKGNTIYVDIVKKIVAMFCDQDENGKERKRKKRGETSKKV